MVMENRELLQGEWKKSYAQIYFGLLQNHTMEAIGRRMKRNTFHLHPDFDRWLTKIFFERPRADHRCRMPFVIAAAGSGHIPSFFVAMVFVGTFITVISI